MQPGVKEHDGKLTGPVLLRYPDYHLSWAISS